jgi:hypothetical protein
MNPGLQTFGRYDCPTALPRSQRRPIPAIDTKSARRAAAPASTRKALRHAMAWGAGSGGS